MTRSAGPVGQTPRNDARRSRVGGMGTRSLLGQVLDLALRRRLVPVNVARLAVLPPGLKTPKRGRSLTAEEARALLEAARGSRLAAYVVLALHTGARPGELASLEWPDLDLNAGTVRIRATKTDTQRVLRFGPPAIDALRDHRKLLAEERLLMGDRWPESHLVFVSEAGTKLDRSNLRRLVRGLAQAAQIDWPVTPYTLRHSHGSLLAAAGVHVELLADRLGHTNSRTTSAYYVHPTTPVVEAGADFDLSIKGSQTPSMAP